MKSAQPRELEWNWECSPRWQGQLDRALCLHDSLLRQGGSSELDRTFDVVLAFLINRYHRRDWLSRSGEVSAVELDEVFDAHLPLRVYADITNIAKRYDLTHDSQKL